MAKLRCKCPGCQKVLQFEAKATQTLRVTCPSCQRAFTISAAGPREADGAQEANPLEDLFAQLPPAQSGFSQPGSSMHFGASGTGYASNYAPPRARKQLSPKAKKQIMAAVGIAGGAILMLVVGFFIAVPLIQRAGVAGLANSSGGVSSLLNFDSREAVIRDLESECQRLEAIGRAIPKGDQSEEAARPLLDGRPALRALLRRACRLPSVQAELADAVPGANGGLPQRVQQAPPDPGTWFWSVDTTNASDRPVTDAINQLTLLRGAVYSVATLGVLELPSPLEAKDEKFQWTDEERRVLAAFHLQGRFRRDFVRALAAVEPDQVNAEALKPLYEVIDQYSKAARELAETSQQMLEKAGLPSSRMLIEAPKRTPYHMQSVNIFSGLVQLGDDFEHWKEEPQFEFLMQEQKELSQDIEDIMFGSNRRALFLSEQTSLERYQALAAKRQAEADRLAALEAKKAREAEEKQRLADERRREEEAKREQAAAERQQAEADRRTALRGPLSTPPGRAGQSRPRPEDFGRPPSMRRSGGSGRPGAAFGGETPSNSPSSSAPRTDSAPAPPQPTTTIKIRSQNSFDSNRIVRQLSEKTGIKRYQSSQMNKEATLRFTGDADLQRFVDAIDFGTVESVDEKSRTISVTIP